MERIRPSLLRCASRDFLFLFPVVAACVAVGISLNLLRTDRLPLIPMPPDVTLARSVLPTVASDDISLTQLELQAVVQAFESQSTTFVDARERPFFDHGHIPGAISVSRSAFKTDFETFGVDKRSSLIVYCSDLDCPDSEVVAKALLRLGYPDVKVFKGGWKNGKPEDSLRAMIKRLQFIEFVGRLLLAGIFLLAGATKLRDPQVFADGIASFDIFPGWSVNLLALVVPILEFAAAILLLTPRWCRQGALLSALLAVVFVFLFSWALIRGLNVECACFGQGTRSSPTFGVIRGTIIFLIAEAVYLIRSIPLNAESEPQIDTNKAGS